MLLDQNRGKSQAGEEASHSDDFLSVRDAAALLGVSYGSVLAAIHNGSLPAFRFGPRGGIYRVRRNDLAEYISSCRTRAISNARQGVGKGTFTQLDTQRLLKAWRAAGVSADQVLEASE
jgi:excisionase family DNA binding protein